MYTLRSNRSIRYYKEEILMAWKTLECDSIPDTTVMSILIVRDKGTVSFTLNCDATKYISNKGFSFYEVMHDLSLIHI